MSDTTTPTIAAEEVWAQKVRQASERAASAEEFRRDALEARNNLIRDADQADWPIRDIVRWSGLSRASVNDIIAGRRGN